MWLIAMMPSAPITQLETTCDRVARTAEYITLRSALAGLACQKGPVSTTTVNITGLSAHHCLFISIFIADSPYFGGELHILVRAASDDVRDAAAQVVLYQRRCRAPGSRA